MELAIWNSGFGTQDLELRIWNSEFDIYINCCFVADDQVEDIYKYDLVEVGPLKMISSGVIKRVKTGVRNISSSPVPLNWWTEFSP